ncbi:MAG TPA: thioredoxin fold domain-containing protein [Sulfuricurvum sp.]|nr:thioredoxin fold domain-containing protein [Sulfuricurvum sp.]
MKKILIAMLTITSLLMANEAVITELNALTVIKENQITVLKIKDEGDIYLVKGESALVPAGKPKKVFTFYVTKDKKILIMGNGIYTATKEKVTFPLEKNILEGKEAFSYGSGKETLYVFLDPECPYCKLFEKKMATLKEKYTFKIYLFPLPFHADALPMSKWILSGQDNAGMGERLIAIANGSTEYKNSVLSPESDMRLTEIINSQIEVANKAEIRGTPTVLDSKLNKVSWQGL